jgi:hypothetical protein
MNLDARAIAVQGIGFGPKLVAVQGFLPKAQDDEQEDNFSLGVRSINTRARRRRHRDKDDDLLVAVLL